MFTCCAKAGPATAMDVVVTNKATKARLNIIGSPLEGLSGENDRGRKFKNEAQSKRLLLRSLEPVQH
jgi:hypothetical protein